MTAPFLILLVSVFFILAYRFYGIILEAIFQVDSKRPTPAFTHRDGVDYVPSQNRLMLFGHHFSSIAGAGPIVGPIMACLTWGWGPALAWVVLGSVFFGGIHDYGALMISIREQGSSVGDIAWKVISRRAKLIFSIFLWCALILIIAVFAYLAADTFTQETHIVLPSLGLIPLAILVGFLIYQKRYPLLPVTGFGLACLAGLIVLGQHIPIFFGHQTKYIWILFLIGYCTLASLLPVNYLLQPRDYFSSFLLFGGIVFALLGLLITHPTMKTPLHVSGSWGSQDALWPMMFITIACGAISGFHALISSGTTSKQITREADAKRIGFGGMLVEGLLAALVITLFASCFSLSEFNFHRNMHTNPVTLFGESFGRITKPLLGPWGNFVALFILNAFILTTLDSATRIARYITQEILPIKNRLFATLLVILCASPLALAHDHAHLPLWKKIWPIFGASNQLVAALALIVITCWLLQRTPKGMFLTLIPAVFMLITALSALLFKLGPYWRNQEFLLVFISIILIIATLLLVLEIFVIFNKRRRHE